MIIAQISDTHIAADHAVGAGRAETLRRCVADINRQGVDAVIHTGDNAHNGVPEEYARLREILADLDAPFFTVPGNRDRRDTLREAFGHLSCLPKNGDFLQYTVDDYPVRLVAMDSHEPGDRKGAFCARRLAWLEETLAREPDKPTFLFIHHPPFDIEGHYVGGYRRPREAENLTATVSRHSQVKRLLCGHVHCLYRAPWGGTLATTMPSVAMDLRIRDDALSESAPLYLLHVVSENGDVTTHTRAAA